MGRNSEDRDEYACTIVNNNGHDVGHCKYYKPNEYDEIVIIEFKLSAFSSALISFSYFISCA